MATATIESQDPPGTNPAPATTADPRKEYVAGGWLGWYATAPARALPWTIDDLTGEFGDDLYDRMLLDPQIRACVNILKAGIIEDGVQLLNARKKRDEAGYAEAQQYVDFCNEILNDLETSLDDALWNLLDAMPYGNKLAEQVYDYRTLDGQQRLVLRTLKVKPRTSTAFVVDPYMNVLGILARETDLASLTWTNSMVDVTDPPENLLPKEKFAILSFRSKDGDPRGTSILRAAYSWWWTKQQIVPEYLKYLTQFASPSLVGTTAPEEPPIENEDGTKTSPVEALLQTLLTFRNGTALALPNGGNAQLIYSQGDGAAFLSAFELCDKQIGKAIVHQRLATDEGQHMARAAAQVHQDVLEQIIRQMKKGIARMIRDQILRPLIRYNYGDQAVALTPRVSLGDVVKQDVAKIATAIGALVQSRFLDPSQFDGIDEMLGLPERLPGTADYPPAPPAPTAGMPAGSNDQTNGGENQSPESMD
jgi:hypothetical protein